MPLTGSPSTRLVVLRGNSASGKSTVARLVRAQLRPGPFDPTRGYYRNNVALIEQDYIRRTMLGEHDRSNALNIRATVPDANLREWYRADDLSPRVEQRLVPEDRSAQYAADQIISSVLSDAAAAT